MHYFKTEWVLLSQKKLNEREFIYKIFFRDYGILNVKKLKKAREKNLDSWYVIICEIITHDTQKNILPSITNIKIKDFFNPEKKTHSEIYEFLSTIAYIEKSIPSWFPHIKIYNLALLIISNQDILTYSSHILLKLKIRAYNGDLPIEHTNINVQKILKFVYTASSEELFKLKKIPEEMLLILKTLY